MLNISTDENLVNGLQGFAQMDIAHQIPSMFHNAIDTEHHLLLLPYAIFEHWSRLGLIQPGLRKNSRTALMCHPHLRFRISWVLHEGCVVHGKQSLARC